MPIALFGLTARSKDRFGYAGAERIETRWRGGAERMCLHGKWRVGCMGAGVLI
ncbi:MAG: hypothetical protein LBK66_06445 [Spirochaetaceae bacterium]|nr:hypothetical protein [Spirochaetaceae bacterium]